MTDGHAAPPPVGFRSELPPSQQPAGLPPNGEVDSTQMADESVSPIQKRPCWAWKSDSFSFSEHCRFVPPEVLSSFAAMPQGSEHPRGSHSSPSGETQRRVRHLITHLRQQGLEAPPGYVILRGLQNVPNRDWRTIYAGLSRSLGEVQPQNATGMEIREVRDRGTRIAEGSASRYSDSRFGGSMHTDGAECPLPVPDFFSLLCVQQAAEGGVFQMVSAASVRDRLIAIAPDLEQTLHQPFHFDRRGDPGPGGVPTAIKPILFWDRGGIATTYLREYVDAGHSHPGSPPLSDVQRRALDALDTILADTSLIVGGLLAPGDMLFVNNKRILHSRTTFKDGSGPTEHRLLLRMWLRRES